jgi:hypothetical protein
LLKQNVERTDSQITLFDLSWVTKISCVKILSNNNKGNPKFRYFHTNWNVRQRNFSSTGICTS